MPISAVPIVNGLAPTGLPKAIRFDAPLVINIPFAFDLTQEQDTNDIEFVQAVFVDNRNNAGRLIIDITGVPQQLAIPTLAMGVFPVFCGGHFRCNLTALGAVTGTPAVIPLIFLNVPQPYFIWTP